MSYFQKVYINDTLSNYATFLIFDYKITFQLEQSLQNLEQIYSDIAIVLFHQRLYLSSLTYNRKISNSNLGEVDSD